MALTKDKKQELVNELAELFANSKMTVITEYKGTPVKAMQELRRSGQENGTKLKVFKNRLVKKALEQNFELKDADTGGLTGMLLYAFNREDEVAPAKVIAEFAKKQDSLKFVGAISSDGKLLSAEEVAELAKMPSKTELIAQVIATLQSPTNDILGGLSGGISAILSGLEAKASN